MAANPADLAVFVEWECVGTRGLCVCARICQATERGRPWKEGDEVTISLQIQAIAQA
jgi:hypothetical protein